VGIGVAGGLEPASAGFALAISSTVAISGALAASAMGDKYGRLAPVSIALIVQMVMMSLLTGEMSFIRFAATAAIFQVFWNLTGPYVMGTIASSDASGRAAVLIPAAQTGGFFLGPAIATLWVTEGNLYPANVVGMISCLVALAVFVPLAMRLKKASAPQ
jgi:MFS family permease